MWQWTQGVVRCVAHWRDHARRWQRVGGGCTRWAAVGAGPCGGRAVRLEVLEVGVEELLEAGALHLDRNRRALVYSAVHL